MGVSRISFQYYLLKKFLFRTLLLLGVVSTPSIFACEIHDGDKTLLPMPERARRIVTLAPNLTEFVFAAGAGDRLVGVSSYSDFPHAATKLPVVADYHSVDLERMTALQPDLIIALKGASNAVQLRVFENKGVPVYWVDIRYLSDIPKTISDLGCLAGTQAESSRSVGEFKKQHLLLQQKYASLKPVRVFFEMSEKPLLTVTDKTLIDDVITLCGGRNIFADANSIVPMVNVEEVLSRNPEAIVSASLSRDWKARWLKWPEIVATKQEAFISLEPDWIERAGPRILKAADQLCVELDYSRK